MKSDIYFKAGALPARSLQDAAKLVVAGGNHSMVVLTNGTVLAWGEGDEGQLGDGTTLDRPSPTPVRGLSDVIAIAAGPAHSLALHADGTASSWGRNAYGEIGASPEKGRRMTPGTIVGLTNTRRIAVGRDHSVALLSDGTVCAWGSNYTGQLGNGWSSGDVNLPVKVRHLSLVVDIAAGQFHNLALAEDGKVWAWGINSSGQLGDGTKSRRSAPVALTMLPDTITAIAAGEGFSLALAADGTVWAWGSNALGQVGKGALSPQLMPRRLAELTNVKAIAAGARHSLALTTDGAVWAWGYNYYGQLGNGDTMNSDVPVRVRDLKDVTAISAAGGMHNLAVRADGTIWAWGCNDNGQLGVGDTLPREVPMRVPGARIETAIRPAPRDDASLPAHQEGIIRRSWG